MAPRKLDRSILKGESFDLFSAAIKSPATRDPYERKLLGLLARIGMTPDDFVKFASETPSSAEKMIISLLLEDRVRIEKGDVAAGTINNWLKVVRLFLTMNDVTLNWAKIRRVLPKLRRVAHDRIPTIDELRQILHVADIRGKALTLLFISSGVREGAILRLRIEDYTKIDRSVDSGTNAARLSVPESSGWIVTMWHVNFDSLERYAGQTFEVAWEDFTGEWVRAYTKQIKGESERSRSKSSIEPIIRLERQEYPNSPIRSAVEQKLSALSGTSGISTGVGSAA